MTITSRINAGSSASIVRVNGPALSRCISMRTGTGQRSDNLRSTAKLPRCAPSRMQPRPPAIAASTCSSPSTDSEIAPAEPVSSSVRSRMVQEKTWMWCSTSSTVGRRPSAAPRYSREAARALGENTKNQALIPGSTSPVANHPACRSSHSISRTSQSAPRSGAWDQVVTQPPSRLADRAVQHRLAFHEAGEPGLPGGLRG